MRTTYAKGAYRGTEQSVLIEPYLSLTAGTAKRGYVACHGYTADATAALNPAFGPDYDIPSQLGCYALSPDAGVVSGVTPYGGGASFGNDDSITALGAAVTYLQTLPGVKSDKIILQAGSMGALVALNWARQNLTKVAAIALVIPALDLQYLHDTAPSQSQNGVTFVSQFPNAVTDIQTSWGGGTTPPAGYYNTHSPIVYASQLAGIPMTLWVSGNDAVTNSPAAPNAFVSAVGPSAAIVNCGAQGGLGHSAPCATLPAIAGYLQSYL